MDAILFLALIATVVLWRISAGALRRWKPHWFYLRLSADQRAVIARYFQHYQRLGPQAKRRFEHLTALFHDEKDWRGVGMQLEGEMRVMISASAAQLLFGLPDITLEHFDRILIYRAAYPHPRSGRMHQGEVNPSAGIIRLSWAHYLEGYARPGDAHNVALHELAHALWFEDIIPNGEDDFFDKAVLRRWNELATEEIERIRARKKGLFRDYAGTNREEFFAVAVEYFFERPQDYREELPELYACMVGLLRQDPAALSVGAG